MEECKSGLGDQKKGVFPLSFDDRALCGLPEILFSGAMKAGAQLPEALPFAAMLAVFGGVIMCVIGFGTDVFFGYDFFLRFLPYEKGISLFFRRGGLSGESGSWYSC